MNCTLHNTKCAKIHSKILLESLVKLNCYLLQCYVHGCDRHNSAKLAVSEGRVVLRMEACFPNMTSLAPQVKIASFASELEACFQQRRFKLNHNQLGSCGSDQVLNLAAH